MNSLIGWIVGAAAIVAFTLTGIIRLYALRTNFLDVPNLRSSHETPTPRGGGAAIVVTFLLSSIFLDLTGTEDVKFEIALWAGGGLMALVGLVDDWKPQSARLRLFVHLVASTFVVLLFFGTRRPDSAGAPELWVYLGIAIVALVWVSNLFNFMDGIDGIASSEAIFIMTAGAWLSWVSDGDSGVISAMMCLAAATTGFAIWNWPPAKIFMGDVGSGFLGFTIGVFALYTSQTGSLSIVIWLILGGAFLTDATVTLLRRILRGDRWIDAHRIHAYQHLARRWKSHLRVTVSVSAINVFWLLPCAYLAVKMPNLKLLWLLVAELPLVTLVFVLGAGRQEG
jgi:Fuc2NAc and GlcNAc transferase